MEPQTSQQQQTRKKTSVDLESISDKSSSTSTRSDVHNTLKNAKASLDITNNKYAKQKSEAFTSVEMFALVQRVMPKVVEKMEESEKMMILQSGQKWSKFGSEKNDSLSWVDSSTKLFANSKVTANSSAERPVFNKFSKCLIDEMKKDSSYASMRIKDPTWGAVFSTKEFSSLGLDLWQACLLSNSLYRNFRHSAFTATMVDPSLWLNMARLSWLNVFKLLDFVVLKGAKISATGKGGAYYLVEMTPIDIKPLPSKDPANLYASEETSTMGGIIAHATCIDWRKILRNQLFKKSTVGQDAKIASYSIVYQLIADWMKDSHELLSGVLKSFSVDDSILDGASALSQSYFVLLQKMKRMFRACVSGVTGLKRIGIKGTRVATGSTFSSNESSRTKNT